MTLDQLRIFVAVAEALSMTRAAELLHLTQPSVSASVAALEGHHRLRLFDRVGRGLELSEAGRAFLPEARAILARVVEAEVALSDLAGLRRGNLRVAASQTVATYWLPARMARFATQWPGVVLSLCVSNTQDSVRAVLSGEADLAYVEGVVDEPLLHRKDVGEDRLGLYTRPGHPLEAKPLSAADLRAAGWVLREEGSGTRAHLAEVLSGVGLTMTGLDIRLTLPSNGAVLEALSEGGLITAVSDLAAASRIAAGQVVRLDWQFPRRKFSLLHHRARRLSTAARAFIDVDIPVVSRAVEWA